MSKLFEQNSAQSADMRSAVSTKIWGMAVGMIAICIPLSAVTKSGPIIPLAVIAGAAASTVAIWGSDKKSGHSLQPYQVQALLERIDNLETIVGVDDMDLQLRIKQLETSDRKY